MSPRTPDPRLSRRGFLRAGSLGAAVMASGGFTWGRPARVLEAGDKILVNQAAYGRDLPKLATVLTSGDDRAPIKIELRDANSNELFQTFETTPSAIHRLNGAYVAEVDFSGFQKPGTFTLQSADISSPPFAIDTALYESLTSDLGRAFYLQRCGVALADETSGLHHQSCHTNDAALAHADQINHQGAQMRCVGGWHDAGDYGKYVTTTALCVGELLSSFERHPDRFRSAHWSIPESSNGLPDLLSEMKVGIRWLLTMQREDGASYRKVAGSEWPSMSTAPEHDEQQRFVFGVSSSDTAMAMAAFAIASRAYKDLDDSLADECTKAADNAWQFLEANPNPILDRQWGDDDGSGPYFLSGDAQKSVDKRARLWALTEMCINNKESSLIARLERNLRRHRVQPTSWTDPSTIGFYNILHHGLTNQLSGVRRIVRSKLRKAAELRLRISKLSMFGLADPDFIWGYNRAAAQSGLLLANIGREFGRNDMIKAAARQADFILGENPFDKSFVTGVGSRSVDNVHHRFSLSSGRVVPGLLVGGPNENAESGIATPGEGVLSYVDDARSFATNEFAIDHNAALIGLLTELSTANTELGVEVSWIDRILEMLPW